MGLDMYLKGQKFFWGFNGDRPMEDGFPVSQHELELGYWRKHPDLHGFIVQTFADGVDKCQEITLSADDLHKIIDAINGAALPHTEGFFFGHSDESDKEPSLKILHGALKWLEANKNDKKTSCSVVYRASW